MKGFTLLSLAALGAAFVIPDEQVMNQVALEAPHGESSKDLIFDKLPSPDRMLGEAESAVDQILQDADVALEKAEDRLSTITHDLHNNFVDYFGHARSINNEKDSFIRATNDHHKPNLTVYQLIATSKYTTKLAELINEYPDVVELLNGTVANYTVFAPIDSAFEKIPKNAPKPSKEELKQVLLYHVSDDYFPARRVLVTHTIPTLLKGEAIGGQPQRLGLEIGLKGLTVNFYDRIIAINIVSTSIYRLV